VSYSAEILADSPTAYWRLGESSGTTAADETGTHAGTYVNTPTLGVAGALDDGNTAVTFNGTDERVLTTTLGALGSSMMSGSLEWWVKTSTTDTIRCMFGTINATTNVNNRLEVFANTSQAIAAEVGSTAIRLTDGAGATLNAKIAHNIYDGAWHHCVLVVESATTISWYVDGVSRTVTYGTTTSPSPVDFNQALTIGARNNRGTIDLFFPGSLDEVAFYPTRLTSTRVEAHYAARVAASAGGGLLLLGIG